MTNTGGKLLANGWPCSQGIVLTVTKPKKFSRRQKPFTHKTGTFMPPSQYKSTSTNLSPDLSGLFFRPKFPTHYNTLHHVGITRRCHYSIYHKPCQTTYPFETCSLDACRTTSHHNNLTSAVVSHTSLITAFAFTLPTFVPYERWNLFPRRVPHRCVGIPLKVSRACKRVYYLFNSAIFSARE